MLVVEEEKEVVVLRLQVIYAAALIELVNHESRQVIARRQIRVGNLHYSRGLISLTIIFLDFDLYFPHDELEEFGVVRVLESLDLVLVEVLEVGVFLVQYYEELLYLSHDTELLEFAEVDFFVENQQVVQSGIHQC